MATQSFMKTFTVTKRNAIKVAKVLSSNKRVNLERNFTVNKVNKDNIRTFLDMEK